MAKEIIIKVPHGVLGVDLKTHRFDVDENGNLSEGELVARDMETHQIIDLLISSGFLTPDDVDGAFIRPIPTNLIDTGVIVEANGKKFRIFPNDESIIYEN